MSVPVESDIAPVARLLIYAILPDGEVVGDSARYKVEHCLTNKVSALYGKNFQHLKLEVTVTINSFLHLSIGPKELNESSRNFQQGNGRSH